jgi:hypothetical protein
MKVVADVPFAPSSAALPALTTAELCHGSRRFVTAA